MSEITPAIRLVRSLHTEGQSHTIGGDPPDPPDMDRVAALEKSMAKIEATLPTLATKEEVHKGFSDMVKWIVGSAGVGVAVMTFILNNMGSKAPSTPSPAPQPIVLVVPTGAQTLTPVAPTMAAAATPAAAPASHR